LTELGPIEDTYDVEDTKMDTAGIGTEHTFLATKRNVESQSSPVHLFLNEVDLGELGLWRAKLLLWRQCRAALVISYPCR
jgi:hypothetical protein